MIAKIAAGEVKHYCAEIIPHSGGVCRLAS